PSPRYFCWSRPKSVARWVTKRSSSTKLPGSSSRSSRSRAESLPFLCCWAMRSGPPPCSDWACLWCSRSRSSRGVGMGRESTENRRLRRVSLRRENDAQADVLEVVLDPSREAIGSVGCLAHVQPQSVIGVSRLEPPGGPGEPADGGIGIEDIGIESIDADPDGPRFRFEIPVVADTEPAEQSDGSRGSRQRAFPRVGRCGSSDTRLCLHAGLEEDGAQTDPRPNLGLLLRDECVAIGQEQVV